MLKNNGPYGNAPVKPVRAEAQSTKNITFVLYLLRSCSECRDFKEFLRTVTPYIHLVSILKIIKEMLVIR